MIPRSRSPIAALVVFVALSVTACASSPKKDPPRPGETAPVASTSAEPLWLSNARGAERAR